MSRKDWGNVCVMTMAKDILSFRLLEEWLKNTLKPEQLPVVLVKEKRWWLSNTQRTTSLLALFIQIEREFIDAQRRSLYPIDPNVLVCGVPKRQMANLENDDVRTSKWSRNWSLELKTEFILWHRISNSSYVIYVCVVTVNRVVLLLRSPWDLLAQVQNFHKNQESIGRKSHCT